MWKDRNVLPTCFKLFAQASIVLMCGINLAHRLCPSKGQSGI